VVISVEMAKRLQGYARHHCDTPVDKTPWQEVAAVKEEASRDANELDRLIKEAEGEVS
jgi:hypothetical protein